MDSLNTISLESNKQIRINFDGGDLSSDAGLLLFKEFLFKIGALKLINRMFKTNDTAWYRIHKDDANLMQVIYQIISAYFEDDCADELTNEPVMTAILEKGAMASQTTLSRFFNRMGEDTLSQLNKERFYNEHTAELILYQTAERYLKEHLGDNNMLNLKGWKADIKTLALEKNRLYSEVQSLQDEVYEAETIRKCVEQAVQTEQTKTKIKQKNMEL